MNIHSIIDAIRIAPDCIVYPPKGLPTIKSEHVLPDDVREFYTLCGGVTLFQNSVFPTHIVSPGNVVLANPIIIVGINPEDIPASSKDSITWSWYIISEGPNGQYITIDLDSNRPGRCYNSFWSSHADDAPIIALSFTDFLYNSLFFSNIGEHYYWNEDSRIGFQDLGRANEETN